MMNDDGGGVLFPALGENTFLSREAFGVFGNSDHCGGGNSSSRFVSLIFICVCGQIHFNTSVTPPPSTTTVTATITSNGAASSIITSRHQNNSGCVCRRKHDIMTLQHPNITTS